MKISLCKTFSMTLLKSIMLLWQKMGYKISTKGIKKLKYQDNYEQFTSSLVQTNIFLSKVAFSMLKFLLTIERVTERKKAWVWCMNLILQIAYGSQLIVSLKLSKQLARLKSKSLETEVVKCESKGQACTCHTQLTRR